MISKTAGRLCNDIGSHRRTAKLLVLHFDPLGVLCDLGDTDEGIAVLQRHLERSGLHPSQLATLLDSLCCISLCYDRSDLLHRADAWSNEALRYDPHAITLKGTRGSILVELGRHDEGVPLLRKAIRESDNVLDHVIGHAFLAKAMNTQGNSIAARRHLSEALAADSEHRLVKRIANELSSPVSAVQAQRP